MGKPLRLIILGPQGSGKGTQAELIIKKFSIPQISTGGIFRENIQKQTDLGMQAKEIINQGKLVSDKIVNGMVKSRLKHDDAKSGFILDGFPRNLKQADALDGFAKIDAVIEISISDKEAIRRISGRRTCKCGAVYHIFYNPPAILDICDKCHEKLFQRDDDKEEAIKKRLQIYHDETEILVDYYKGKHIKIDGEQPIEDVFSDILAALKQKKLIA